MDYVAQGIGFVGMALVFIAFQFNDKRKILYTQALAGAAFTVHFALLGGYTGAVMNFIEIARNLVFARPIQGRQKRIWIAVFVALFTACGALSWQNWFSLMPILAMNLSTFVFSSNDPKKIRRSFVLVSILWMAYNVFMSSIAAILTEGFNFVSLAIAMFRFDLPRRGCGRDGQTAFKR